MFWSSLFCVTKRAGGFISFIPVGFRSTTMPFYSPFWGVCWRFSGSSCGRLCSSLQQGEFWSPLLSLKLFPFLLSLCLFSWKYVWGFEVWGLPKLFLFVFLWKPFLVWGMFLSLHLGKTSETRCVMAVLIFLWRSASLSWETCNWQVFFS